MTCEAREGDLWATSESARLRAVTDRFSVVKSKLATCRVEGANSRWSARAIHKAASKVEDAVSKAHMAMSGEVANVTKQKASFVELELKDSLKKMTTLIRMESQAAFCVSRLSMSVMIVRHYATINLTSRLAQSRGGILS